ncbi:Gfo/Idh/MocA family protein [Clostridium sp.]|uniref:Gfo/Idh/MocA family protein n=1 Tax=Clostridium sp. TaxID=1506 RepID=UPI003D6D0DCC
MKFLVVGSGSMGKRRIRLLKENYGDITLVGVDLNADRCAEIKKLYNIKTYTSLDEAIDIEKPDAALICTSPIYHSGIILNCLKKNLNVFTEINLISENYDEIIRIAKEKDLKLFLSSTFLYRNEIKYIIEKANNSGKLAYSYHVGQYLPDWHPWESYKDFFVADKRTNGCRELMAIELPWIVKAFGEIKNVQVIKNNITNLNLGYYDNYMIMFQHENGNVGSLNVDIASRSATRSLEVYNEELHIKWEGTPETLLNYNFDDKDFKKINTYEEVQRDNKYVSNIIENAYLSEITTFIDFIKGDVDNIIHTFQDDYKIIKVIDLIEGME